MAISIAWGTKVITIPKTYLGAPIIGTLYELDTNQLRIDLKDIEDSEEGIAHLDTHRHSVPVTVAGVTYARTIEIINGYSITFEDGQYSVRLAESNNNFFDVENGILNQNQVQVIAGNAAGLIVSVQGSGITEQDKNDIVDKVWDEVLADHTTLATFGGEVAMEDGIHTKLDAIQTDLDSPNQFKADVSGLALNTDIVFLKKIVSNKKSLVKTGSIWELIIYDNDDITPILQKDLKDSDGNNITDLEAGTLAQELSTSV